MTAWKQLGWRSLSIFQSHDVRASRVHRVGSSLAEQSPTWLWNSWQYFEFTGDVSYNILSQIYLSEECIMYCSMPLNLAVNEFQLLVFEKQKQLLSTGADHLLLWAIRWDFPVVLLWTSTEITIVQLLKDASLFYFYYTSSLYNTMIHHHHIITFLVFIFGRAYCIRQIVVPCDVF